MVACVGVLTSACRRGADRLGKRRPRLSRQAGALRHRLHPGRTERHPGARAGPKALGALAPAGRGREPARRRRQPRRRGGGESSADGHTWLLGNNSILATNQSLYSRLPYDPVKDFAPVALVAVQPNILVVHPDVPAQSLADLIHLAKQNPGKLNYASSGAGAAAHLAGELFKSMAGVDIVHVPYKGAQPALTDLIAGHAQLMFATSASVIPYMKAGRLRALAVTTPQRSPSVPDLPTMSEAGLIGFEATTWHGVVVPSATPDALVQQLNQDINAVLKEKELSERLAGLGAEILTGTPRDFQDYIAREIPKWAKVVKDSGARAD
jgi:tripartite-type tricarboxylate transporter receptor subunit TctC